MKSRSYITRLLLFSFLLAVPAWAQDEIAPDPAAATPGPAASAAPSCDLWSRQYLSGDWGGQRTALEEKGISLDFFYITDLQGNPTGGPQQSRAGWKRIRGAIDINFGKMMSWQGLSFDATGLWQSGANLGGKIGTLANPSDPVSAHTTRPDSFWRQQFLFDNKLRIRAGQLADLDFYGNQEYGGWWLIEPMGYAFGTLFSSIFESFNPAGTPGVEVYFAPTNRFYVKSAVMAGNRDPYQLTPYWLVQPTSQYYINTGGNHTIPDTLLICQDPHEKQSRRDQEHRGEAV